MVVSILEVNALESILERLSNPWVVGAGVFLAWVLALTIIVRIGYWRLHAFARRTRTDIDDLLISALRAPLVIVILVTGAVLAGRIVPLTEEWKGVLDLGVKVAVILAGVLFADAIVKAFL